MFTVLHSSLLEYGEQLYSLGHFGKRCNSGEENKLELQIFKCPILQFNSVYGLCIQFSKGFFFMKRKPTKFWRTNVTNFQTRARLRI